jgi:hypothetical protein
MAYLGNGIYDLLDVIKASKDPSIAYEGLYQDPRRYDTTYYGGDLKTYPYGMTDASGAQALISSAFPQEYGVGSLFNPRVGRPEQSIYYKYQPDLKTYPYGMTDASGAQALISSAFPQDNYASQKFQFLPEAYNQSEDVEQVDSLTGEKKFNVLDLLSNFIPGKGIGSFLAGILPKDPPEVRRVKDFYARNFGVNKAGSVASGIMEGYNPVSGGFLNYMTGGRYGEPMQVGLAGAMQKRIEKILGRKIPQTDASRKRVQELRNLQLQEMRDRADAGETLSSIGKSTFTGKGKAFEAQNKGTFTTPSGQKGYYGGR